MSLNPKEPSLPSSRSNDGLILAARKPDRGQGESPMSKQNSNRGFTLQELMIVMAIVTIMSASLLPNINTAMQNYRLKASAEEIASQIQSARYRALRSNTVCAFLVLPSSRQFGVDV